MIYLDHAATTPVPKAVADAMYTVLTEQYANPNAQYPFGQEMRRSVEDWRAVCPGHGLEGQVPPDDSADHAGRHRAVHGSDFPLVLCP